MMLLGGIGSGIGSGIGCTIFKEKKIIEIIIHYTKAASVFEKKIIPK